MTAPPTGPAPAAHPNPPREQAPGQGGSRIGCFLGLLGRLILYGHNLADRLSQGAGTPAFARLAIRFGTTDVAAIIRRITRGLMLAAALHERLSERAARGRDITPHATRVPSRRKSATPRPRTKRAKPQAAQDVVALPTPEQIAAMLRRRPLGAVIVDICLDLGILRGDVDRELWRELHDAIIAYGGSLARYLARTADRVHGPVPESRTGSRRGEHSSPAPCGRIEPRSGSMPRNGSTAGGVEKPQSSAPLPLALATGPP